MSELVALVLTAVVAFSAGCIVTARFAGNRFGDAMKHAADDGLITKADAFAIADRISRRKP